MSWIVIECATCVHVEPTDDLRPHDTSESCWCHPSLADDDQDDEPGAPVWVHNSLDGRERHEGPTAAPLH